MRRCKALRNMLAQIERLSQGVICITSTAFQSAVSNLRDRGIAPKGCESFQASDWKSWSTVFADALPVLTKELSNLRARDPSRSTTSADRLWRYGKGNRQFFQRLLRKRATTKLESMVDPTTGNVPGTRAW